MDLVLEIGCEEIPASFLEPALATMLERFNDDMDKLRISHGDVKAVGTPRRLALIASDVAGHQADKIVEVIGPPVKVSYNEEGVPTAAAEGFARSQGLSVGDLSVISMPKGEYLCASKREAGRETAEIMKEYLPQFIAAIPFPKTMRWNETDLRFARPIRWLVAVLGGQVIPFTVAGVSAGAESRGHRFMRPGSFPVTDGSSYIQGCRDNYVIVDHEERKGTIALELEQAASRMGGGVNDDPELLSTVSGLVEYPFVDVGSFDPKFLDLPREVLIDVMREAQFYFSLSDGTGRLMPNFLVVSNIRTRDQSRIVRGNERVLKARLTDARFFFEEDRKKDLDLLVESLKDVTYQAQLGSMYEKTMRLKELARYLAGQLDPGVESAACQAAYYCKADLLTQMVAEFPKLQGIMGREYALQKGIDPVVARAIPEQYLPVGQGEELPQSMAGTILSIADKMDALVGYFSVGLTATGTADPYGLRRAALGIINIVVAKGIRLSLNQMVREAYRLLAAKTDREETALVGEAVEFFRQRLFALLNRDYPFEVADAALSFGFDDIGAAILKAGALEDRRRMGDLSMISLTFKRVTNILGNHWECPVDPILLIEPTERELYELHRKAREAVLRQVEARDFGAALETVSGLKGPIDKFFDDVLVMAEDESLRRNRLNLLSEIRGTFLRVADFSRIPS